MKKNIQKQTNKPVKKQNPFLKYKDIEVTRTDCSVDFNFSEFKENSKEQYKAEKLKKLSWSTSGLCVPLIATSYLVYQLATIPLAVVSLTFAAVGELNVKLDKKYSKELHTNKLHMHEYSKEQKTYLFKKMYTEFEKHLENGKKLVENLIKVGVVITSSMGIAMLTQYNSLKTFAIVTAMYCVGYKIRKVLDYFGEKKAIKEIENMMNEEE